MLASGSRLGSYELLAPLGKGGMGEVYRAKDLRLGREVAVKILPDQFASDPDRLARFQREAQVLASLNHPNIAAIYGLEESDGTRALVLELVPGETLADRISRGPLPFDESLLIAKQIAEALEAAHGQGIVHRDLKPANITITPEGTVKVLDFGLAKLAQPAAATTVSPLSMSPTLTSPAMVTGVGMLLGTAPYMSPEQARGRDADKRSDVWAFGCVLFEMLTGRRAFSGEDVPETVAAVLRSDPDWTRLPPHLSVTLRRLLARCLERDTRRRIPDMGTIRFLLDDPQLVGSAAADVALTPRRWRLVALATIAGIVGALVAIAATWALTRQPSAVPLVTRFAIPINPPSTAGTFVSLSPDGTKIVYATDRLWIRALADPVPHLVQGTDQLGPGIVSHPTFSPDGQSIVFWFGTDATSGEFRKVPVGGGAMTALATTSYPFGVSWGTSGIVYSQLVEGPFKKGIFRITPDGGTPEQLVTVKPREAAIEPQLLDDGDALLFTDKDGFDVNTSTVSSWDKAQIVVQSLRTGDRSVVTQGSAARYDGGGHLVYAVGNTVFAASFDVRRLRVTGKARAIVDRVDRPAVSSFALGSALFSLSNVGSLLYVDGTAIATPSARLAVTRSGLTAPQPLTLPDMVYGSVRVSPDGTRIAYDTRGVEGPTVSTYELSGRHSPQRLTFDTVAWEPVWSPDGQRIAYESNRGGGLNIWSLRADGTGEPEPLTTRNADGADASLSLREIPMSWSPDGMLLFSRRTATETSLQVLSPGDRMVRLFADVRTSNISPIHASFSPDGTWVAYSFAERTGAAQHVFVRPFPATAAKYQVGGEPGFMPVWSKDGRTLYYLTYSGDGLHLAVNHIPVTTQPTLTFGNPVKTDLQILPTQVGERQYDLLPDGSIIVVAGESQSPDHPPDAARLEMVLNWAEDAKMR